jgi:uncharacterized cupin superfamily protein
MPNILDPHFDQHPERPGFDCRRARIGRQAGSERLGASVWDLPPGEAACPYHFHLVEEELLFVLAGRPSLRSPDGWRELGEGEVVAFPVGPGGAHQLMNRTGDPVRLLLVSGGGTPDVCIYPDSGKLGAFERRSDGGGLREMFRRTDAVDYWDGEEPPEPTS